MSSSPESSIRRSMSVDNIPESSSVESSLTPSPISSLQRQRLPSNSSGSSPSITFAPLPKLGPRKRRSRVPLGVSGRAELMRRRRTMYDGDDGARYRTEPGNAEGEGDDLDVVFVAMG